jgi:uncharacterized protein
MNIRPMHLEKMNELKKNGNFLFGGAILDDKENMIGSVVAFEFPGWDDIEAYLETEPYVSGGVWKKIDIKPFRMAKL